MQPADKAALEGLPEGLTELAPEAAEGLAAQQERLYGEAGLTRPLEADRYIILDREDPDARAALRHFASRKAASRPVLARDIIAGVGDELAPGEQYVEVPPELPWERGQ